MCFGVGKFFAVELLEKKYVRNKDTQETLLHVVEEPVTRYLPSNSRIIGNKAFLMFTLFRLLVG